MLITHHFNNFLLSCFNLLEFGKEQMAIKGPTFFFLVSIIIQNTIHGCRHHTPIFLSSSIPISLATTTFDQTTYGICVGCVRFFSLLLLKRKMNGVSFNFDFSLKIYGFGLMISRFAGEKVFNYFSWFLDFWVKYFLKFCLSNRVLSFSRGIAISTTIFFG